MTEYILDIETNSLENYDKVWSLVLLNTKTEKLFVYRNLHENPLLVQEIQEKLNNATRIIGHNIFQFDYGVLSFLGLSVRPSNLCDTLVVARLLNYSLDGGHSLEAWGERFKFPKTGLNISFNYWSKELEERCIQDCRLTLKLYNYLKPYIEDTEWKRSIELEHKTAWYCRELHENGFGFDLEQAQKYKQELEEQTQDLLKKFSVIFPARPKFIREITPSVTKAGTLHAKDFKWLPEKDLRPFSEGASFSIFEWVDFNPLSPKQVVTRLNEAGWKPTEKTKGYIELERKRNRTKEEEERLKEYQIYGWKVCEENLETLPESAPEETKQLANFLLLRSRLGDVQEWCEIYNKTSRSIHGMFNGIGSWTHRKSHSKPNMANIPALVSRKGTKQPYGAEFRSLFRARPDKVLVGCDADGIQLRLFAHYCNDERLIQAIAHGNKEDGTDIHTLNKGILGTICNSRNSAKTYIYALLLGAGMAKQAQILQCTKREALDGLERILNFYPGWKDLKDNQIRKDGQRGFFVGLDGRKVMTPGTHYVLAGYLQNGESTVMKLACDIWHQELLSKNIPFWFVNDVHDEWQTETYPEYAEEVGKIQANAIVQAGLELNVVCPLAGSYVIGNNWKETH